MLRTCVILVAAIEAVAASPTTIVLSQDGSYAVAMEKAGDVFRQCSRGAPVPDSELWTPSQPQIVELEAALPNYLASQKALGKPTPPDSVPYDRQYVGFSRNGARLIYANFLPKWLNYPAAELRARPIVICDGGSLFWGIVYNPAARAFEEPQFNGP